MSSESDWRTSRCKIGMVGLGRMGSGMTKRLERDGHEVATYDPNVESTAKTLGALAKQLEPPRHVWMMVPSGKITEDTFRKLLGILEPGDTIIDGGNSNFRDSQRRYKEARKRKISFVDVGVSGGVWGLEVGFCLMAGGDKAPLKRLAPIFESLAPEDGWAHVGGVRRGPLHEDGPQRDRVRADAGLRRGLRADVPLRVRPRPERDRRHLALRLGRPLVAARAAARCDGAARRPSRRHRAATSRTPARAAGRSTRRSTRTCPSRRSAAALFARFASRREIDFSAKVQAALRNQFGGHAVKAAKAAKAAPEAAVSTAENPLLEGLRLRRSPDPCAIVIFGASGDLTRRKIFPALYSLAVRRLLPERFGDRRRRAHRADDQAVGRRDEEGGQGARPRRVRRQRLERARRRDALRRDRLRRRRGRGRRRRGAPRAGREARDRRATASTTSPFRRPRSRRS